MGRVESRELAGLQGDPARRPSALHLLVPHGTSTHGGVQMHRGLGAGPALAQASFQATCSV